MDVRESAELGDALVYSYPRADVLGRTSVIGKKVVLTVESWNRLSSWSNQIRRATCTESQSRYSTMEREKSIEQI
jgi:hypothetical protein